MYIFWTARPDDILIVCFSAIVLFAFRQSSCLLSGDRPVCFSAIVLFAFRAIVLFAFGRLYGAVRWRRSSSFFLLRGAGPKKVLTLAPQIASLRYSNGAGYQHFFGPAPSLLQDSPSFPEPVPSYPSAPEGPSSGTFTRSSASFRFQCHRRFPLIALLSLPLPSSLPFIVTSYLSSPTRSGIPSYLEDEGKRATDWSVSSGWRMLLPDDDGDWCGRRQQVRETCHKLERLLQRRPKMRETVQRKERLLHPAVFGPPPMYCQPVVTQAFTPRPLGDFPRGRNVRC